MPCPAEGISLEDKQKVTEILLSSGAEIGEINIVRKHLSKTKGGRLGAFYSPATVISLILSDVIGNDISTIASAPTFPDPSTFADAASVLKRYGLLNKMPNSVIELLNKGVNGEVAETPDTLHNCHNYIIGDNVLALEAMAGKAREVGLKPYIISSGQKGDVTDVARLRSEEILSGKYAGYDILIIGGETTIKLPPGAGKGGRNQHYAAVSMTAMAEHSGNWLVASIGTDGSDFIPDVAGAIVDRDSFNIARAKKIDMQTYIERFDSFTMLDKIGNSLIITGDTGTNVGDVILYLIT
jgi:glycerate-2-kinase